MEQSILKSIKKLLDVGDDDTSFDLNIIMHINSALSTLNDLGAGPDAGYFIEDNTAEWGDFLDLEDDLLLVHRVKQFVYIFVRLVFDPPTTPHAMNAAQEQLKELTFRLNVRTEETKWVDPDPSDIPEDLEGVLDGGTV